MKAFATSGVVVALSLGAASAQEELTLASPAPGPAAINAFLTDWAAATTAASNGALTVNVVTGGVLGREGQMFDRVAMGVVDMAWDLQGYYPGQFPLSGVVEQPFQFSNAEQGSLAFQKLYETGALGGEYDDVEVLALYTFPNASLMLTEPLDGLEGLAGSRITAQNPTMQAAAERLGGVALNLSISDWYQALNRGTIDGAIITFTAVPAFRLNEVMSEFIDVQLGGNPAMFIMNRDRYAALSEAARTTLDAHSGVAFAQAKGAFLDDQNDGAKVLAGQNGSRVRSLSEAELAEWRDRLLPLTDTWLAGNPARAAVRDEYLELLSRGDD